MALYLENLPLSSVEYIYHDKLERYKFGDRIKTRKRLVSDVDILVDYRPKEGETSAQIIQRGNLA